MRGRALSTVSAAMRNRRAAGEFMGLPEPLRLHSRGSLSATPSATPSATRSTDAGEPACDGVQTGAVRAVRRPGDARRAVRAVLAELIDE